MHATARSICVLIAISACLVGCGGQTLAGKWKSDQNVPGLLLDLAADGTYTGILYRSEAQSTSIAGNYSVEGDMMKINIADVHGGSPGRQVMGTLAQDKRTFKLDGFGVLRRQ